jgi:chromosome segregation ATPase
MKNTNSIIALCTACLIALCTGSALAQQKGGTGLVCWKDKSGKTVGCGDKVPPEYQDNASQELNKRGMTVNQKDAALTPEQKAAQQAAAEQKKNEAMKQDEQARRDRVLLDSFTNDKEIDLKRNRDIQQVEVNISAQQSNIKTMTDRMNDTRAKIDALKKENKPVPPPMQQDYDKLAGDIAKLQEHIAQKRKEIADKNVEYDAMKKRFIELKSGAATVGKK